MTEICAFCGNKHLSAKKTRYMHQLDSELLFVDGVPCIECDFCGEQYFDGPVLMQIEEEHQAILAHKKQPKYKQVAIESFEDILHSAA